MLEFAIQQEEIVDLPFMAQRPRRNRKMGAIRALIQETHLAAQSLVAPLFIVEGQRQRQPIESLPGILRLSIDQVLLEASGLYSLGIKAIALFPSISSEQKDRYGSESINPESLVHRCVKALKKHIPELCIIVDIALDPFTSHGHDGLVGPEGYILNDTTVFQLGRMACLAAEAGADIVAPSDMMDGRVAHIRQALDKEGHHDVSILAYAAKYASAFYGPFREALGSSLKFGDKRSYQMDPANSREALREIYLDEQEGADMLLIKPALAYLDIVSKARQITQLPLGAYHVSGEYAMVMAAAANGWLDADRVFEESLLSIKRAGADFIFTYAARRIAEILQKRNRV